MIPPVEEFEDGIIEQVCSILEGGERAFDQRRKSIRYLIKVRFRWPSLNQMQLYQSFSPIT